MRRRSLAWEDLQQTNQSKGSQDPTELDGHFAYFVLCFVLDEDNVTIHALFIVEGKFTAIVDRGVEVEDECCPWQVCK